MAFDVLSRTIKESEKTVHPDLSAAARILSKLGASKGGLARARKLSANRRKEIAIKAAKARYHR